MSEPQIGHTHARDLASMFLQDDMPALQAFHSTGAISPELGPELVLVSGRHQGIEIRALMELASYVLRFGERVEVPHWEDLNGHRFVRARLTVELPVPKDVEPLGRLGDLVQRVAEIAIVSDVRLDEEL